METNEPFDLRYSDPRTKKILGFLVAKRLLYAPWVKPVPTAKIHISDLLWVAENVEPRVYEVLPAALLHFPASFLGLKELPSELAQILAAIEKGIESHSGYKGIAYEEMHRWANHGLPDRRTRPVSMQKRRNKTFRLSVPISEVIQKRAAFRGISESKYIENLVCSDSD